MVDKLVLLCPDISRRAESLALHHGIATAAYAGCCDLRKSELALPVRLSVRGRHNGIHKVEFIDVSRLGLPRTQEIVEFIFPDVSRVKIYRIDLCADVLGLVPWFFVTNSRISRRQNYALYRSRGAVSYYLEFSKQRKIVFYDRLRLLRKQKDPLANIFEADEQLTRIEIQLMGSAVPYKRFTEMHCYADIEPLKHLHFRKLRVIPGGQTPTKRLAAYGFRWLILKFGQQATSRMFSPPEWAWLKTVYLEPMKRIEIPEIDSVMGKSTKCWLDGKIYSPRGKN